MVVELNKELHHEQLHPSLAVIFPSDYSYTFQNFSYSDTSTLSNPAFTATVLINAMTEAGACEWIKDLEDYTNTTYRSTRGNSVKGCKLLYKTDRHC